MPCKADSFGAILLGHCHYAAFWVALRHIVVLLIPNHLLVAG